MTATSELKDGALTFAFKHKCAILKVELENISKKEPLSINYCYLSQDQRWTMLSFHRILLSEAVSHV